MKWVQKANCLTNAQSCLILIHPFALTQVTALMGAHTLGEAQTDASGYRGVWIGGQSTDFNNVYYKYLTGVTAGVSYENRVPNCLSLVAHSMTFIVYLFQAVDRRDSNGDGDRKWQWQVTDNEGNNLGMMLNTDMELAYEIGVDNAGVGTQCLIPFDAITQDIDKHRYVLLNNFD